MSATGGVPGGTRREEERALGEDVLQAVRLLALARREAIAWQRATHAAARTAGGAGQENYYTTKARCDAAWEDVERAREHLDAALDAAAERA